MEATIERHSFLRLGLLAALLLTSLWLGGCASMGGAGEFNTIIIDPGHGGQDQGALATSGMPEKMLTLDTANRLTRILRSQGFRVIQTRTQDYFITLDQRSDASNRESGSIFVSIHYNWARSHTPHGIETYYYSGRSQRLAANILREVLKAYPTVNRGIKYNNYHVLRTNRRPAVLCELGFVSSPYDNRYVQDPAVRQRLAERIAAGIIAERQGRQP